MKQRGLALVTVSCKQWKGFGHLDTFRKSFMMHFVLSTDTPHILANARLCADMKRDDLSKALLLASRATKFEFDLWIVHPFGLPLVVKLFNYFFKQKDHLAMFLFSSFVFSIAHKHKASQRLLLFMDRSLLKVLLTTVEYFNEILLRWEMRTESLLIDNELSNYTSRLISDSRSLGYEQHEFISEIRGAECLTCPRCEQSRLFCMVCSQPVRGLSVFCGKCGHGGHQAHVIAWFAEESACALGCGCVCLVSN
jgi:hypothetical protein